MSRDTIELLLVAGIVVVGGIALYDHYTKTHPVNITGYYPVNNGGYGIANTSGLQNGQQPWYNSQGVREFSNNLFGWLGEVF